MAFGQLLDLPLHHLENRTYTYSELIQAYEKLDEASDNAVLIELGMSDAGFPIQALVITNTTTTKENVDELRKSRWVLAVNNGIHPGESCGVDASLHWANEMLGNMHLDDSTMIVIIPMYNIGGALNRRPHTRANQNGPQNQGFRGNARNFDLNRDLIKADTKNTLALYNLFSRFDPEIFIDTHSTNGADYPYEMTLITSPWQKYPEPLGPLVKSAEAYMFEKMEDKNVMMSPYVNVFGRTPNAGFTMFEEGAMYTTGYAALCGAVAFVTEAHMLKPYENRVASTRNFLDGAVELGTSMGTEIILAKKAYRSAPLEEYVISWEIDSTQFQTMDFQSYQSSVESSLVTTGDRLKYNHEIEKVELPYYNGLMEIERIVVPVYYYIPLGQWEILDRFKSAGVQMDTVTFLRSSRESISPVVSFHIENYEFASRAYEGHMPLVEYSVVESEIELGVYSMLTCCRVSTQQVMGRYVVECLEPKASSSFFKWNMFSTYLQQKEHYSSYVFEDTAQELLDSNEELKSRFNTLMQADSTFANNPSAQLYWIYEQSDWFEPEFKRLPYFKSVD